MGETFCEAPWTGAAPPWWAPGEPLDHRALHELGAAEYIEAEEWDLQWRLCRVPLLALPSHGPEKALRMALDRPEEAERFRSVAAWFRERGGPAAATAEAPVVCIAAPGGYPVELLDGWHRTTVAALYFGDAWLHAVAAAGRPSCFRPGPRRGAGLMPGADEPARALRLLAAARPEGGT
jgi:hypothetical protein